MGALNHTLSQHGVSDFDEARYVRTVHIAHRSVFASAVHETGLVDEVQGCALPHRPEHAWRAGYRDGTIGVLSARHPVQETERDGSSSSRQER